MEPKAAIVTPGKKPRTPSSLKIFFADYQFKY